MQDQRGKFGGIAQARWKRHRLAQRLLHLIGQAIQHGGGENTRRDGQHPDAGAGKFPRRRQGQRDDAAFRRRIGGLTDLTLVGGDGSGADDDPAFCRIQRFQAFHIGRRQAHHVERADQVDVDDPGEIFQVHGPVVADDLARRADTGAIHQYSRRAVRRAGLGDGVPGAGGAGHIAFNGQRRTAIFDDAGDGFPGRVLVAIQQGHSRAGLRQRPGGRQPQPRSRPADQGCVIFNQHFFLLRVNSFLYSYTV